MLAPTPFFLYDMQNNMNNYICKNDVGGTLRSIPPTLDYKEKLMIFSRF